MLPPAQIPQASQHRPHLAEKWIPFSFPTLPSGSKDKEKGNWGETLGERDLSSTQQHECFQQVDWVALNFEISGASDLLYITSADTEAGQKIVHQTRNIFLFLVSFLEHIFVSLPYHFHALLHSTKNRGICAENPIQQIIQYVDTTLFAQPGDKKNHTNQNKHPSFIVAF